MKSAVGVFSFHYHHHRCLNFYCDLYPLVSIAAVSAVKFVVVAGWFLAQEELPPVLVVRPPLNLELPVLEVHCLVVLLDICHQDQQLLAHVR